MGTLMLRLAAPMQSWGIDSIYDRRSSGTEPSKSGVIGMISAAMGRGRDDPVDDLNELRMGVRVDQPGSSLRDYHTVHKSKDTYVTNRRYIADAVFIVGLEGERPMLEKVAIALNSPYYPLFLGRRSCPVTGRIVLGITDEGLEESLKNESWQAYPTYRRKQPPEVYLETIIENSFEGYYIQDVPVSFSQRFRKFVMRRISRNLRGVKIINTDSSRYDEKDTIHDAFSAVRGD